MVFIRKNSLVYSELQLGREKKFVEKCGLVRYHSGQTGRIPDPGRLLRIYSRKRLTDTLITLHVCVVRFRFVY